jgi:Flp pilus assembly protein TadD
MHVSGTCAASPGTAQRAAAKRLLYNQISIAGRPDRVVDSTRNFARCAHLTPAMFPPPPALVRRFAALLAATMLGAAACAPARADEQAEITRLAAAGQAGEALARLDRLLEQRPKDPQLRFQKGVILAESQHPAEAKEIFAKLTVDYPEIPEPHNNLAVLYAASGDYDKARAALDAALRANPNYAVAHQNMGDVHAQLARLSYMRALQLDPSNAAVPPKLALLRELVKPAAPASSAR